MADMGFDAGMRTNLRAAMRMRMRMDCESSAYPGRVKQEVRCRRREVAHCQEAQPAAPRQIAVNARQEAEKQHEHMRQAQRGVGVHGPGCRRERVQVLRDCGRQPKRPSIQLGLTEEVFYFGQGSRLPNLGGTLDFILLVPI